MNTYCVEVKITNCLLAPDAKKALFNRQEEEAVEWGCQMILYVEGNSEEDAKKKSIQFLKEEPNLQLLTTNTPENPKRYYVVDIELWTYSSESPTQEIPAERYLFSPVDEQGDWKGWAETSELENVVYEKISKQVLYKGSEPIWNPVLCTHISNTVQLGFDENDRAILEALPEPIMHLYYLWMFQCEVGGNGIDSFVLQGHGHEVRGCYAALQAVGHKKLVEALGMGIALSLEPDEDGSISAEYAHNVANLSWFNAFKGSSSYKELHEIDDAMNVYDLTNNDLEGNIVDYIKANISDIATES
ncbi:DMP19 family protein [Arenicella xantha]|uniref:DNA mimic protein DMP19 C-terminal domain-containing protein n=1 Tax=Arenicella xantha TaxID=644221 RepID=A0A395JLN2_9GAMM|nr:hypothetical protein [Arenicella xantha]RBP49922.1 hypothetical protein DFR28_103354 [Arenicella xantha]